MAELQEIHSGAIAYFVDNGFAAQSETYFRFPAGHNEAHFSLIWYAAEVANETYLTLHRKADTDSDFNHLDMRRSFKLGHLIAEWNLRGNHQASTRRGIKTEKLLRMAAKPTQAKTDCIEGGIDGRGRTYWVRSFD